MHRIMAAMSIFVALLFFTHASEAKPPSWSKIELLGESVQAAPVRIVLKTEGSSDAFRIHSGHIFSQGQKVELQPSFFVGIDNPQIESIGFNESGFLAFNFGSGSRRGDFPSEVTFHLSENHISLRLIEVYVLEGVAKIYCDSLALDGTLQPCETETPFPQWKVRREAR